jgi:hypothetical protein
MRKCYSRNRTDYSFVRRPKQASKAVGVSLAANLNGKASDSQTRGIDCISYIKSNGNSHEVIDDELGRLWFVANFKVMSQNLSESTKEKHEKP